MWWRKIKCFYNPPQHQKYLVFIRKLKKSFSMCVIHNNVDLWKLLAVCIKSLKNVPNRVVDASLIIQKFDSTIWRPSFNSKKVRYILRWLYIQKSMIHPLFVSWNRSKFKLTEEKMYHVSFLIYSMQSAKTQIFLTGTSSRLGHVIFLYLHILNTIFGNWSSYFLLPFFNFFVHFNQTIISIWKFLICTVKVSEYVS